jgi:hypothetical protein
MSVSYPLAVEAEPGQLGGLTGWVASVIESLGAAGVGLLVALENLIPPIPHRDRQRRLELPVHRRGLRARHALA